MNLSPLPIQKFFDNNGAPLVGGLLFTYIAGTTTKIATGKDQAGTLNTNPIVLDFRGEANVWLDPTLTYKFTLAPLGDTDPPTKPIWTVDNIAAGITAAYLTAQIIGQILYPRTPAEIAAGVVPTNYFYTSDAQQGAISIKRYGAGPANTTVQNKAALQAAISVASAVTTPGGVFIEVPADCPYGYVVTTRATWPSFAGATREMVVIDHSPGASYIAPAKDGMQVRYFYNTVQTAVPGQHDGNGQRIMADWAPYFWIDNQMDLSGVRTANDNRRAIYYTGRNGVAAWGMGQGTLTSAVATDDELMNWQLTIFSGPKSGFTPWVVNFIRGNMNFGTSSNGEEASYWFKSPVTGYYQAVFESLTTTSQVYLRTSNGATDDAGLKNVNGDISCNITTQGDAWTVSKANRRFKVNQNFQLTAQTVTYSASMTIDAATGNIFTITATNAVAFTINAPTNATVGIPLRIRIRNASGGALGVATFNAVFKMPAWVQPANGFSRTVDFDFDGTNWVEAFRSAADVPN